MARHQSHSATCESTCSPPSSTTVAPPVPPIVALIMGASVIDDVASQSASPSLSSPQRVPWMAMLQNPITLKWMPKRVANCRSQRLIFMHCTYLLPSSLFSRTHACHPECTEYRNSEWSPRRLSTRQSYRYPDEVVTACCGPPLLVSTKTDR